MSSVATGVAGAGRTFERVSVVKALAGRKVPASVAHAFAPGGAELVVVEKYKDGLAAAALDQLERDARILMALRHPNVATVRDVWREDGALCVASEYVEGETLEELRRVGAGGKDFSIEVGVRVVVDVLAALSAIHGHAGAGLSHGEVTASNVVVGFDGTTRLVRPFRGRVAGKVAEADLFSYVAPEVVKGGASDVRADLYAVGVILWETLSRRKLFPKATREGRAARSMPVGKPVPPPDAAWAAPLGAVAERALANEPSARYTTGAEMAAAVRLAVRSKLAMPPRVSAAVDKLAGEKILARRNTNALPDPSAGARISVRPARPSVPPEAVRALSGIRPSSRPPPPKATPAPPPAIPKMPPLPSLETPRPGEAKPRPIAPPFKLAEPKPPPPVVPPPPSDILDAFVESVREPAPLVTPPPTPAPPVVAYAEPPVPVSPSQPQRRRAILWIAVAVLCALVALAAVVGVAISGSKDTKPAASGQPRARETTTTSASGTPTPTVTTTATTSAASTTTAPASASAEPSATAEPDPTTTTAPADPSHRPHTRPRPTYDPMGI